MIVGVPVNFFVLRCDLVGPSQKSIPLSPRGLCLEMPWGTTSPEGPFLKGVRVCA